MKKEDPKINKEEEEKTIENSKTEDMVNTLITLHSFPLESEEDLEEKKNTIEELKKLNNNL